MEVKRNEFYGKIAASIFYAKQSFMKNSTNVDVKDGFRQAVKTIEYYKDNKVDNDFMSFAVKYHAEQEQELKEKSSIKIFANYDDKLNRQRTGRLIVFSQVAKLLE